MNVTVTERVFGVTVSEQVINVDVVLGSRNALWLRGKRIGDISGISLGETIVWDGTQFIPGETSAVESFADLSGQIANAQVPASAVTQHQAALSIAETQIPNGLLLARVGDPEVITGAWSFSATPTFSTMTSGSVLFAGTAGALSQNNSAFFWDNANERLGIRTTTPNSRIHIVGGTLSGTSGNNNVLFLNGTFNATNTATARGVQFLITSAGSSAQDQEALTVELAAGYTGGNIISGLVVNNFVAGTGTGGWTISAGSFGVRFNARGTTDGHNVGASGNAQGSSVLNLGGLLRAVNSSNTPALNIGGGAKAASATVNVGFFAGLSDATPAFSTSAALIADNMAVASAIFLARDNGTTTFTIADGGNVTSTARIESTSPTGGIGYGTGAGGTVTQGAGSGKATALTLSRVTGAITMNNATLNAGAVVSFTWTNTAIAATSRVIINFSGGTAGAYAYDVQCGAGTATVTIRNLTAGNLSEAIVLNFNVWNGATS